VDNRDEKIGRKIRDAEVRKLPYMLIVGEKEVENNMVSVRKHGSGDLGSLSISDFLAEFKKSVAESLSQQA
jgi:threonyl-tRNA synthetase